MLTAAPVDAAEFAAALDRLGPFGTSPCLAVALSGGPDSTALCLLADRWARGRGGSVAALTVDHRLRPGSAAEAAAAGQAMAARGIVHAVLPWAAAARGAGQAAAREGRYALLGAECRRRGIRHLLLGHTLDDQAETVLLRLAQGSGVDGLAGMPARGERAGLVLLRPLLAVPKARLVATCQAFGAPWVDDPSNADPRFARGRLRAAWPVLEAEGLTVERLATLARRAGQVRGLLDRLTDELIARAIRLQPLGWALVDHGALGSADPELARRALGRVLATVGGVAPVRLEAVERLGGAVADVDFRGATGGGCRIRPIGRDAAAEVPGVGPAAPHLLVCRELRGIAAVAVSGGERLRWDGRFRVGVPALDRPAVLAPLGRAAAGRRRPACLPYAAAAALPALWRDGQPLLGPRLDGGDPRPGLDVAFDPARPLSGTGFTVA